MIKIINKAKYDNLLKCLDEAICNNYELRKVCQCRQCKWGAKHKIKGIIFCVGGKSINYTTNMDEFGSCEKCERR